MGEYASYRGESVKIGTCEEMYYLRADQALSVRPESGSVDPARQADLIRFRFRFRDEDMIEPGGFDDYGRRIRIDGLKPPEHLAESHYSIQFRNDHGYNLCIQCPESVPDDDAYRMGVTLPNGLKVHRNGFKGSVFLAQERLHDGLLVPVLSCACGMGWRLPGMDDAAPLLEALEAMHRRACDDRYPEGFPGPSQSYDVPTFARKIADRIRQGFDPEYVASILPAFAAQGL